MAETYTRRFGVDFLNLPDGSPFPEVNAAMTIAKKWRRMEEDGIRPDCDPGDCTVVAVRHLFGDSCKLTPWSETMLRDITAHKRAVFLGPASSGKSHVLAAWSLVFYLADPFNTICILCTETLKDLSKRAWSPVKKLSADLLASSAFGVNLEVRKNEYCVRHAQVAEVPGSASDRHAITGVALEEGRLQGAHPDPMPDGPGYILLGVDELSLITNLDALATGMTNISIGADFRFVAAANPGPWTSEVSSRFYMPPGGPASVTPDTGSWVSKTGYFIRHFDGEKSPCVLDPLRRRQWPFLISAEDIQAELASVEGDRKAARYMKMVRGWPSDVSDAASYVLDSASAGRAAEPLEMPAFGSREAVGVAAGVDPAWTPDGDEAVYARAHVLSQDGRLYIDFSQGVRVMPVRSSADTPVLRQLRDSVVAFMREDAGPPVSRLAVDSSGNQMLGAEITTWVGPGCLEVNSGAGASENFLRSGDAAKEQAIRARVYDRGTEAWVVLAEFVRAGMVRGLPQEVVNDLCNRRFMTKPGGEPMPRLRLERKGDYSKRSGRGSPNKADACALCALAVKERMGVMPYSHVVQRDGSAVAPQAYAGMAPSGPRQIGFAENTGDDDGWDDGGYGEPD